MTHQPVAFFHAATSTISYLVWDEASRQAALIDPVLDYEPRAGVVSHAFADQLLAAVAERNLHLIYVLETHAHADHLSAADYLRRRTGAKVVIGEHITSVQAHFAPIFGASDVAPDGSAFDILVADGDRLALGERDIQVLHTPGHTAACVTYLIDDAAYVGDTLFMPDYGTARTDFPGGDAATLYRSIRKILGQPAETRIFVGHDYLPEGRDRNVWETTVGQERARNIHVHDGVTEAEFVARRQARDATLAPPLLILPSLQVNIRAGALPPPSEGGRVFLRIPVTVT
ncbi:MBL fold metallo-hydrolase [Caulobacter sp. NIBR1757]|uniref:MBL fold metallo-hydrolase n=1 Tax=Caulobacter sp. NIBR1757 TaxID=3016000 RepID=UPI0022F01B4E|nr:MBL fold metallo-hydrolase [Caulobacter sp. NIBR1757]WGM37666.1 putative metallo-hydrolase [Caulobacter sp. NIBR1757]